MPKQPNERSEPEQAAFLKTSLVHEFKRHGKNLQSADGIVALRSIHRVFHGDCFSFPSEHEAVLDNYKLYLPFLGFFKDINPLDFSFVRPVLDVIITDSLAYSVFSSGDDYCKNYLDSKERFIDHVEYAYSVQKCREAVLAFDSYPRHRYKINLNTTFNVVVDSEAAYVKAVITIPTRYKSFTMAVYEKLGKVYLEVPLFSTDRDHPISETLIFTLSSYHNDVTDVVRERYKHRIFYSHFKKEFDLYYGDNVTLDSVDFAASIQIIEAIKM